jgi:putative sigma-54 modulation protein
MDVKINSVNFTADRKLIDFINEKMQKLELMNDHIVSSEVFLKVDNGPSKENKIAEVKIHVPGNELFASKQCKSFEEAVDSSVDALKKQVEKHKTKQA